MTLRVCLLLVALPLLVPSLASASSVLQVSFDEAVLSSEFIFEGRVTGRRAEMDARGMIHTFVTFEVLDVLKGKSAKPQIVLRYLGGSAGTFSLNVPDLSIPEQGEKGIYFVESLSQPLVHPLYGWDQGHFLVIRNEADQTDRVFSKNHKPIVGFQRPQPKATGLSTGIAVGLLVAEPARRDEAVTVSGFKQRIRQVIASQ